LGIAKTAREEKKRARDEKLKQQQENERMAKLYRQHVLKEQPGAELITIGGIASAASAGAGANGCSTKPAKEEVGEEVGSFGD
jgi:hypothetical protein